LTQGLGLRLGLRRLRHNDVEEAAIEDLDVQGRIVALAEGYVLGIAQRMQFVHQLDGGRVDGVAEGALRVVDEAQGKIEASGDREAHAM